MHMKLCYSASQGIYFQCTQCGKCCSNDVDGDIFIFWDDIRNISKILNLSYEAFAEKYLKIKKNDFSLYDENLEEIGKEKSMYTLVLNFESRQDCLFLEHKAGKSLCKIYQARPAQCEQYPFWSMIMTEEATFSDHRLSCPGFSRKLTDTTYFTPEDVEKRVKIERKLERDYYLLMKKNNFNIFHIYPFLKKVRKLRTNK